MRTMRKEIVIKVTAKQYKLIGLAFIVFAISLIIIVAGIFVVFVSFRAGLMMASEATQSRTEKTTTTSASHEQKGECYYVLGYSSILIRHLF